MLTFTINNMSWTSIMIKFAFNNFNTMTRKQIKICKFARNRVREQHTSQIQSHTCSGTLQWSTNHMAYSTTLDIITDLMTYQFREIKNVSLNHP